MATTQDVGLLTRKLAAADYDPSRYVSEISQRCVGGEEVWPLNLFVPSQHVFDSGARTEEGDSRPQ